MDSELKTCTNRTDKVFISPGPPSPPSVLLLSQLLRRVKGKGSENTAISGRTQSPNFPGFDIQSTRDTWLTAWLGVLLIVIYLFCLLSYDILFSVCIKQDLEKQHNTSPHFYFFFYFSYQNLGRRNYIFAQLLVTKCYECYPLFDTVGYETPNDGQPMAPACSTGEYSPWQVGTAENSASASTDVEKASLQSDCILTTSLLKSLILESKFWTNLKLISLLLLFPPGHYSNDGSYKVIYMIKLCIDPKWISCRHLLEYSHVKVYWKKKARLKFDLYYELKKRLFLRKTLLA